MTTIYRKYRPQRFADLVGQFHVRTTLTAELQSGKIAHAYLFVGPRGIGKTTTARLFAKSVNCASRKGAEPDNACQSCVAMNQGRSLDLIEIDAASHTQVDHVRENILPAARTVPTMGKFKVFIIDEVHMLSPSAFSALLKMLEEPPAHVIFILATTEPHRVPETIISRCQRFDFRRVGAEDIVTRLSAIVRSEGVQAERSVLARIARMSGGSLRDAESILGQLLGLGEKKLTDDLADLILPPSQIHVVLELLEAMAARRSLVGLELVQRLVDEGIHLSHFTRECVEVLRSLLLMKVGLRPGTSHYGAADVEHMRKLIERLDVQDLQYLLDLFLRCEREERTASIPQLPIELAVVEFTTGGANVAELPPPRKKSAVKQEHSEPHEGRETSHPRAAESTLDVIAEWPRVLEHVRQVNPSVALLLKTASPHGIVDGTLTLSFPYVFHRDRALDARNRVVVESSLSAILGRQIRIHPLVEERRGRNVDEGGRTSGTRVDDVWQQAVRAFGSESIHGSDGAS